MSGVTARTPTDKQYISKKARLARAFFNFGIRHALHFLHTLTTALYYAKINQKAKQFDRAFGAVSISPKYIGYYDKIAKNRGAYG